MRRLNNVRGYVIFNVRYVMAAGLLDRLMASNASLARSSRYQPAA
jgi:hypothetical protein